MTGLTMANSTRGKDVNPEKTPIIYLLKSTYIFKYVLIITYLSIYNNTDRCFTYKQRMLPDSFSSRINIDIGSKTQKSQVSADNVTTPHKNR